MINLSKSEMKKILDEAPEGATDWCASIDSERRSEYGFNGEDKEGWEFVDGYWSQTPLSDLRKQLEGDIVTTGKLREISTSAMFRLIDFVNEHDIGEVGDSCVDLAIQALSEKHSVSQGGEWKNGDIVIYKGEEWFYVGEMTVKMSNFAADCTIQHKDGAPLLVKFDELSKPETEAEKVERERLEAESEITDLINSMVTVNGCSTEEIAKAIVYKTKYRKEVE